MWPSRFVLPSKPRYSAGARASSRVTSGEPSRPRTSDVVSRVRFGPRRVKPPAARLDARVRDRAALGGPVREAAVEDADRFEAVRPEAPPGACREQGLGVVVDHDRGVVGDPEADRQRRDPVRAGQQDRLAVAAIVDQVRPPVDQRGARDVAAGVDRRRAAVGPPAEVEDAHAAAQILGQPLGRGQDLRTGQATHRRYHTAVVVPFLPDPEKLAAVRDAIPALGAGIYLNTGSVGPLPAETAAAMADMAAYERDVGRAHADYFDETLARMSEARAGVAAVLGTDVSAVALTHATTDGMNAATLLPDWRSGGRAVTTAHEHAAVTGPLVALRDRSGSTSRSSMPATTATTSGPWPPSTGRSPPTPGWSRSRTCCGRPARSCRSPGSPSWRTPAARWSSSTAPRPPARSRSASTSSAPTCMPCRRRSGCSGPEGMGALVVDPGVVDGSRPRWPAGTASSGRTDSARRPGGRTPAGSSRRRASTARRSSGWPARSAGCRCSSGSTSCCGAGPRRRARAADRLAAIPGVEVLTPRDRMATLVTFRIAGWPAEAALDELGRARLRHRPDDPEPRRGPDQRRLLHPTTSSSAFAEIVELLAAHTPETLPPRRTLTMLGWLSGAIRRRCRRGARGPRSAGASSVTRRGRSSGPWRPA